MAVTWRDLDLETGVVSIQGTIVWVKGRGPVRKRTKSTTWLRSLRLPEWCVAMLSGRYVGQPDDRPVFPDSRRGWRDRSNVGRDLRTARAGTEFAWVRSHTARRTLATLFDQGMTARSIADQLGHARPSLTQDVYMGRRVIAAAIGHLDGLARLRPPGPRRRRHTRAGSGP